MGRNVNFFVNVKKYAKTNSLLLVKKLRKGEYTKGNELTEINKILKMRDKIKIES